MDQIDKLIEKITFAAVILAEYNIKGDKKGHERKVFVLRWLYDQLDRMKNYPDWQDWIVKNIVIPIVPGVAELIFGDIVQKAFDTLDSFGVINND
jgi:hypothetical protein